MSLAPEKTCSDGTEVGGARKRQAILASSGNLDLVLLHQVRQLFDRNSSKGTDKYCSTLLSLLRPSAELHSLLTFH